MLQNVLSVCLNQSMQSCLVLASVQVTFTCKIPKGLSRIVYDSCKRGSAPLSLGKAYVVKCVTALSELLLTSFSTFFLLVTTDLQHTLWLWVPHSCSGICWDTTAWESFFIFPQIGAQSSSISSVMIVQPIVQQSLTSVLPSIENENFLISPEFICSVKDVCQLWKEYLQSHTRCNWDKLLGFWGPLEERPVEQKRDEHFLNLR